MKQSFKRFISFSLSICIVVVSILLCPISVYATDHGGGGSADHGKLTDEEKRQKKLEVLNNIETSLLFIISELSAHVNGAGFSEFYDNYVQYEYAMGKGDFFEQNVTIEDDGSITYSQDLVSSIKQALQEYADETNPFTIMPTYRYSQVPASTFNTKEDYEIFRSYASSHSMTFFYYYSTREMYLGDVTEEFKNGGGFVFINGYTADFYMLNSNWNRFALPCRYYLLEKGDDGVYHFVQSEDRDKNPFNFAKYRTDLSSFLAPSANYGFLLTKDGGRIRIFHSQSEFMDYSVGQRKVYFGSGFYDFDPADITATWDEISDTIDHMDDILQQILDKITEDTDESAIEDLLQQILDEIRNGGGSGGVGGGSAPSGWFDSILDYLNNILKQLKSIKRWTIVNTVINGVDAIADWLDLIHDILSDVDDGMESAVATLSDALDDATGLLKSKFPFSVPWDIFFFVTLLAAEPETPHFEVPIDFEISALDMHIHYDFIVDFSDYQYLSDIFRVILSMTYAVGLLKMTAGIVNTKKED